MFETPREAKVKWKKLEISDVDEDSDSGEEEIYLQKRIPKNSSEAFSAILGSVGGFGRWQWKLFFMTCIGLVTSLQTLGAIFLAASPGHWCQVPSLNLTRAESRIFRNWTIPRDTDKRGKLGYSQCKYYNRKYNKAQINQVLDGKMSLRTLVESGDSLNNNPEELSCQFWHYEQSTYFSTVVTEWNLVCGRKWLQPTVQASFMFGILIGAIAFTPISDRYGRRFTSLLCYSIYAPTTIAATYSPTFWTFIVLRFLAAASHSGLYLCFYVMITEVSGGKGRTWLPLLWQGWGNIGVILLTIIAYYTRDWRQLHLFTNLPVCLYAFLFWTLPESPRWLMMKGRFHDGLAILEQMAEINGRRLPDQKKMNVYLDIFSEERAKELRKSTKGTCSRFFGGLHSLLGSPNMRRRSLINFYCWFVVSLVHYGITFSGHNLNLSNYYLQAFFGLLELGLTPIYPFLILKFGRRLTLIVSMLSAGILTLSILLVSRDSVFCLFVLTVVGNLLIGLAFRIVYMLSNELVPTEVRNLSIGICSFWARVGSISSPYIVDLLGNVYYSIPSCIFGILAFTSGFVSLLLPETGDTNLPETVAEVEALPK